MRNNRGIVSFLAILCLWNSCYTSYFINETNISSETNEHAFNFYAKRLRDKSGLYLFMHYFLAQEKDSVKAKDEISNKLDSCYEYHVKQLYKNGIFEPKLIVGVFSINSQVVQFKSSDNFSQHLDSKQLQSIAIDSFSYHIEKINYKLSKENGEILKILNEKEIMADNYVIEDFTLASISFLNAVATELKIDLNINRSIFNLVKERANFEFKLSEYRKKEEQKTLQDKILKQNIEKENAKINAETKAKADSLEIKDNDKSKNDKDKKKSEDNESKWEYGTNGGADLTRTITTVKGYQEIDPVTGLGKDLKGNVDIFKTTANIAPYVFNKDNAKLQAGLSFIYKRDYIDPKEDEGPKLRFDYMQLDLWKYNYDLMLRIGDLKVDFSRIIFIDSYRGYQGRFGINLKKKENKEDRDDYEANISLNMFTAPKFGALGVFEKKEPVETMGLMLDFVRISKSFLKLRYMYGEGNKSNLSNTVQELSFDVRSNIGERINYTGFASYSFSFNGPTPKKGELGNRLELNYNMNAKTFIDDYLNLNLLYRNTGEEYFVGLITGKYEGTDVPLFVNDNDAIGQSGYEVKIKNSFFDRRIENDFIYNNFNKIGKDGKDLRKRLFSFDNKARLTEITESKFNYSNERDVNKKYVTLKLALDQKVNFDSGSNIEKLVYGYSGLLTPSFSILREYENEKEFFYKRRFMAEESGAFNLGSFQTVNRMFIFNDNYHYTKERIIGFSDSDNMHLLGGLRSYFKIIKYQNENDDYTKRLGLTASASKGIPMNHKFFGKLRNKRMDIDLDTKGYYFKETSKSIEKRNNYGFDLLFAVPLYFDRADNYLTIDLKRYKELITLEESRDLIIKDRFKYILNKRLDIFVDYDYENVYYLKKAPDISDKLIFEENKSTSQEANDIFITVTQDARGVFRRMRPDNTSVNRINTGTNIYLTDREASFVFTFIDGIGLEYKRYYNPAAETMSLFLLVGLKTEFYFSEDIKSELISEYERHFISSSDGAAKNKYINEAGFYMEKEYISNATSFNYTAEKFNRPSFKEHNNSTLTFNSVGKWKMFKNRESRIGYELNLNSISNKKNDNLLFSWRGEIILDVYRTDSAEGKRFITASDLVFNADGNYKDLNDKSENIKEKGNYKSLRTGGNLESLWSWNKLSTLGGWLTSLEENEYKEVGEFELEDRQKILEECYIMGIFKYAVNITNEMESNYKMYEYGIGLNVDRLVINGLTLKINFKKQFYKYPKRFEAKNKEITNSNFGISYSF